MAQYVSFDNQNGYWTNSKSWVNERNPGTSFNKVDVECYGWLTSLSCIDYNLGTLAIHDTLVINGNLQLSNKANLIVDSLAILLIFGDLEMKNKSFIQNRGKMVVAGNFQIVGSANDGGFTSSSGSQLYLFDETPEIPVGGSYQDLNCDNPEYYPDSCGYGDYIDLIQSDLYNFYDSLPYSRRNLNPNENNCFSFEILQDIDLLCINEPVIYSLTTVGINTSDSVVWLFGSDAIPENALGYGPHEVSYGNAGIKSLIIEVFSDTLFTINQTNIVTVQDFPATGLITTISNPQTNNTLFLDEICRDATGDYALEGKMNSIYIWRIPSLKIDTVGRPEISVTWNLLPGEYQLLVQEISSAGCEGSENHGLVNVIECKENVLIEERNYAITPNGDNINDTWVIENIEEYPEAKIIVIDRNGKTVFTSDKNYTNNWDGTYQGSKLPLDSYFYIINLSKYNKGVIKGIVTILPLVAGY